MMPVLPAWVQWIGIAAGVTAVGAWLLNNGAVLYLLCAVMWLFLLGSALLKMGYGGQAVQAVTAKLQALKSITPNPSSQPHQAPTGKPAQTPVKRPSKVDRAQALRVGTQEIMELQGLDDVLRSLEDLFDVQAHSGDVRKRMRELSRGSLFVLAGPTGTGRMTVAINLVKILYGREVVQDPIAIKFASDRGRSRSASELYDLILQEAQGWLDQVVIFADADWLSDNDSAAVGRALSEVADLYPGRIWIIMVGSSNLARKLKATPELRSAWQKTFGIREVPFPVLSDDAIAKILQIFIDKSKIRWEELAKEAFLRSISKERSSSTYANAITVRQLFEECTNAAVVRLRNNKQVIVIKADVDQAAEQLSI